MLTGLNIPPFSSDTIRNSIHRKNLENFQDEATQLINEAGKSTSRVDLSSLQRESIAHSTPFALLYCCRSYIWLVALAAPESLVRVDDLEALDAGWPPPGATVAKAELSAVTTTPQVQLPILGHSCGMLIASLDSCYMSHSESGREP